MSQSCAICNIFSRGSGDPTQHVTLSVCPDYKKGFRWSPDSCIIFRVFLGQSPSLLPQQILQFAGDCCKYIYFETIGIDL